MMTVPSGKEIRACRSAARRSSLARRSVSETWNASRTGRISIGSEPPAAGVAGRHARLSSLACDEPETWADMATVDRLGSPAAATPESQAQRLSAASGQELRHRPARAQRRLRATVAAMTTRWRWPVVARRVRASSTKRLSSARMVAEFMLRMVGMSSPMTWQASSR